MRTGESIRCVPKNVLVGYTGSWPDSQIASGAATGPSFQIKSNPPTLFSDPLNLKILLYKCECRKKDSPVFHVDNVENVVEQSDLEMII